MRKEAHCCRAAQESSGRQPAQGISDIAKEWDYKKNQKSPDEVTSHSGDYAWWICPKGHSYHARISNRTSLNRGCPYCAGKKVLPGFNDLKSQNPDLAAEWDYDRNGELTPEKVTAGSQKIVWWKCSKGHEWQSNVANRAERGLSVLRKQDGP
jgi:hypothetical protein